MLNTTSNFLLDLISDTTTFPELYSVKTLFLICLFTFLIVTSYILYWIVGLIPRCCCYGLIQRNEKRRGLCTCVSHEDFSTNRICNLRGLTFNRIRSYQIIISWFYLIISLSALMLSQSLYSHLAYSLGGIGLFAIILYYVKIPLLSSVVEGYIAYIYILYSDRIRIGDPLILTDPIIKQKVQFIVRNIFMFDTMVEEPKTKKELEKFKHVQTQSRKVAWFHKGEYKFVHNKMFINNFGRFSIIFSSSEHYRNINVMV